MSERNVGSDGSSRLAHCYCHAEGRGFEFVGGKGKHVELGGHASGWYARLVGFVVPKDRGPKQHVVIKLKGRPSGTFTLFPTEPGVVKRDSGTQTSRWFG